MTYVIQRDDDPRLKTHKSLESAEAEAARLAKKEPGKVFRVFASVSMYEAQVSPAKRTALTLVPPIPPGMLSQTRKKGKMNE